MSENTPGIIKQKISKSEAEEIKKQFEEVGARVEIRAAYSGQVVYSSPGDTAANAKESKKSGCLVLLGVIGLIAVLMYFI